MKKCPCCNSSRIHIVTVDGYYVISCAKCGYKNKRAIETFK